MALTLNDLAWYAARVRLITQDINTEYRMSVQVSGLAETVRKAKAAIDSASGAAARLNDSASRVVNTIAAVDDMTQQLDAANADLTAAVGVMTNGGPPLVAPASSTPVTQVAAQPAETIHSATAKIEAAYVAPPVVTASTIAAANAAALLATGSPAANAGGAS